MITYKNLSLYYDDFTQDVPYDEFIKYYKEIFVKLEKSPKLVLDLGCGTGTITNKMAEMGFEMIGVDNSEEMLMEAQSKSYDIKTNRPMFLKQKMQELDLFGTIDACISSLDCINYITDKQMLAKTFEKVDNFLNPDGVFIFDINTTKKLQELNEQCFVRESDKAFCVWQATFEEEICTYNFDIFVKDKEKYTRYLEEHKERAYSIDTIKTMLENAGFYNIECFDELTFDIGDENSQRVFFVAKSKGDKKCKIN